MMRVPAAVTFLLALLLCLGCSRPVRVEGFIRAQDAPGGVYHFDVDLQDSLVVYDIKLFSRVESVFKHLPGMMNVPLSIVWTAPSGQQYSEDVWMTLLRPSESPFLLETEQYYRRALVPSEYGKWTVDVRVTDSPKGFSGLGLISIRRDGTR